MHFKTKIKKLRPQNARVARAHALPKIYKTFTVLHLDQLLIRPLHVTIMLALI